MDALCSMTGMAMPELNHFIAILRLAGSKAQQMF
jgi:hypothetical protein